MVGTPTRRPGRIGARLIAGGLLVVGLTGAGAAASAARAQGGSPAVVVGPSQPVLATGVAPTGVTSGIVTATVEPPLQNVGDSGQAITVASAPISASGGFVLTADPGVGSMESVVNDAIANNGGWVNMDLIETGANGETTIQSVSRQFVSSSGQMVSATSIDGAGAGASSLGSWSGDEADNESTTIDPTQYAVVVPAGTVAAAVAASRVARGNLSLSRVPGTGVTPDAGCGDTTMLLSQVNIDTVVGEMHTANGIVEGNGDEGHGTYFAYGSNADSSVDVGFQQSTGAPWSVSGSVHIGNNAGSTQASIRPVGNQFGYKIRSGFMHQHLKHTVCGETSYESTTTKWTGVPDQIVPGSEPADYVHNLDGDCSNANKNYTSKHYPGESWSRTTNQLTHFDLGFGAFGFTGGTQSGASKWVQMRWQWNSDSSTYWLCGNDNAPGYAHRIFAGY